MARLFLAISLPEKVKNRLAALQKELAKSQADVRWVRPEGLHLTLKFFGQVPEEKIERLSSVITKVIEALKPGPMHLGLKGVGTFPPGGRAPRVVWVGLYGRLDTLAKLQNALEEAFAKWGFEKEKRRFVPHITLGRVKSKRRVDRLREEVLRLQEKEFFAPQEIEVKELTLYQSILKPTGAVYLPLKKFPLK